MDYRIYIVLNLSGTSFQKFLVLFQNFGLQFENHNPLFYFIDQNKETTSHQKYLSLHKLRHVCLNSKYQTVYFISIKIPFSLAKAFSYPQCARQTILLIL